MSTRMQMSPKISAAVEVDYRLYRTARIEDRGCRMKRTVL